MRQIFFLGIAMMILLASQLSAGEMNWLQLKKWDEGYAEVTLYKGKMLKYGALRDSKMDIITVREFFDPKKYVKTNPRDAAQAKTLLPILKMNLIRRHRTGVYKYVQMNSVFINRTSGAVEKLSCVSSEWCGNSHVVFENRPAAPRLQISSYMDNTGSSTVDNPLKGGAIFYDQLIPWLRQNLQTVQAKQKLTVVQSLLSNKPTYKRVEAVITKLRELTYIMQVSPGRTLKIPAKAVEITFAGKTETFTFATGGTRGLLRWDGEQGQYYKLRKVLWLDYWNHNHPGDEKLIK